MEKIKQFLKSNDLNNIELGLILNRAVAENSAISIIDKTLTPLSGQSLPFYYDRNLTRWVLYEAIKDCFIYPEAITVNQKKFTQVINTLYRVVGAEFFAPVLKQVYDIELDLHAVLAWKPRYRFSDVDEVKREINDFLYVLKYK